MHVTTGYEGQLPPQKYAFPQKIPLPSPQMWGEGMPGWKAGTVSHWRWVLLLASEMVPIMLEFIAMASVL